MISIKNPLRDPQDEPPIAYCPRCGGEIYENDDVEIYAGKLLHAECMTEEELKHCVLRRAALCMASMF